MFKTTHLLKGLLVASLLATSLSTTAVADDKDKLLEMPAPAATMTAEQWVFFSDNLVKALASHHDGLQNGAMRLALQYPDQVDISAGMLDLMRIYRNHPDDNVRRLAAVTLGSTGSRLARNYLRLHVEFEKSECVKRTMLAVLSEA
ncbi:MAG: hypothetical protein R3178_00445 [Rhodothermales bacterium]|nr:hypothetical protein [Rhodothermales bacterium]